ncbi:Acyl-CoA dehydrogenase domain protein OS=Tsukamurella paurometabola (strain ATCC 8368 / DSM/ CCUG 35730 / CIP 100753 / JCM 10117 / KCTC 9821 / NBRC 16120/ NCIMB 702349 / NCTC 13040) OX=521096 GN=Tpau_3043 PE=3 SV=1 [Tsukamurella paurometabola]|uniref:Acyl-CoA dehydrogenase domain protein n=1 Tax=Tsukamurella paurometabola (strain ATCC 8368 / DSM 20162 / CCUG 35730 / CIP 100753 / JCM 10117 / KCTC 9821 / NBRC 16120 / NCIMB 702349 / NCTC 13040) TaxID=521096 RepID=D5UUR8_TSUPD|nr:acyl-CoA dehydrogenase family protein [Tsukamurella paurometabola]ADG79636.1 acyl-CoA dehydrogenase domain protein [Tsukamurella paurometabola DSM 20162]SUP36548.1 Acyl-CoA dehydrogenase, short-chain specific [Tsukamurella paurometabola]
MTDKTTEDLAEGIARSRGTDYLHMRELITDDEAALLLKVREFGERELLPIVNDYWERGEFPFEILPGLRELEIVGDTMQGYGTTPMTAVGQGLVSYELGRIDGSIGTFIGVHVGLAMQSIYILGSEEQRQRWLPAMARLEKIGAFALTEPNHGSDSVALEATATRDGDHWVINGAKRWPGNAVWCDIIIVFARDTADGKVKGFVVEKDDPGYRATKIGGKVSLRMVQNADIVLDDLRIPDDRRLVNCNGFPDVSKVLMGTRNQVAWASTGHAVAAYEIALNYAQKRVQFGKPIANTQVVQSKLVEMLGEVTAMQLYCIRLGRLLDEGAVTDTMAALAKYFCSVKARHVCRLARDVLGGNGITLEFHVMRHLCDMEALVTYEGTAEIQSLLVGREITGGGAFV